MKKQKISGRILCLCLSLLLVASLTACNGPTDEQNSEQPTVSTQPTAEPTPTPPPIPYTDVAEDSPYYDAVVWAFKNGIATDGETFEPTSSCTRGQVMTFLWRANGSPEPQATESPFNDVSSADWFYKPALWAYENGVASGTAFNPGNPCTNAEALTFLWRAEGKPAASVYNSAVALAASGQYYARPAAWAETNGLFAGAEFDPATPCSRADLMTYLYWANEQWTLSGEDKAVQAEYEQIINNSMPFEVYGSGLVYADYIDVDGDGKVELLTVGISDYELTATVYADMDGHVEKLCEGTFDALVGNRVAGFSLCKEADSHLYLHATGWYVEGAGRYYNFMDQFYQIGTGAVSLEYDFSSESEYIEEADTTKYTYTVSGKEVAEDEFKTLVEKFTDVKEFCTLDIYGFSTVGVSDRGLLSVPKTPGIIVNGVKLDSFHEAYYSTSCGAFMVPLFDTLQAMGVTMECNSDASVILASTKKDTLVITYKDFSDPWFDGINSTYNGRDNTYRYSINGGEFQNIDIEFPDRISTTEHMSLDTIVSLFGGNVEWNGKAGAVQITSDIPGSDRMAREEIEKLANFDLAKA